MDRFFVHQQDVMMLCEHKSSLSHQMYNIFYFENKGNGVFEEQTRFANPFGGVAVSRDSSPYFFDIDNDGDKDLFVGASNGTDPFLNYYKIHKACFELEISGLQTP